MPANFMNMRIYKLDYGKLFKILRVFPILNKQALLDVYLKNWLEVLQSHDKMIADQFQDPHFLALYAEEVKLAPENFQIPLSFEDIKVFIHFRVSRIIEALKQANMDPESAAQIGIHEFLRSDSQINWTPPDRPAHIKKEPILMVPLTVGQYHQWLVIDGNHRIADKIAKKQQTVAAYTLSAESLVESNLFCSTFDKMLYIFQNETTAFGRLTLRDKRDAKSLIAKSYLNTGIYVSE